MSRILFSDGVIQFRTGVQIIPDGSVAADCVCCSGDFCSCDGVEFVDSLSVTVDFEDTITAFVTTAGAPTRRQYTRAVASGFAAFNGTYVFDNTNTQSDDGCNWDPFSYTDTISIQFDVTNGDVPFDSCPDPLTEGPVSTSTMNYTVSLLSPGIFGDFSTAKVVITFSASGTPPLSFYFQNISAELTVCTGAIFPFTYDFDWCNPLSKSDVLAAVIS